MLHRFTDSLIRPRQIADYRNDKSIITAVYMFLLILMMTIPSAIYYLTSTFDYTDQRIIRDAFRGTDVPYELADYQLVPKAEGPGTIYQVEVIPDVLTLVMTDQETLPETDTMNMTTVILMTKSKVYIRQTFMETLLFEYDDYENLKNLDLALASKDDYAFWNTIFPVISDQIAKFLPYIQMTNIGMAFVLSLFDFLFFSLILTFFLKMGTRGLISFGTLWKLMVYTMTPYVLCQLLGNLYSFDLLSFAGMIVTVIYASTVLKSLLEKY